MQRKPSSGRQLLDCAVLWRFGRESTLTNTKSICPFARSLTWGVALLGSTHLMADRPISKLNRIQTDAQDFLNETGIESQDEAQMSGLRKFAHFCLLVGNSFVRNRCPVRAAALAYTTLLA